MDLATLIGLLGAAVIVGVAMFLASSGVIAMFVDVTSVLIVLVGTIFVALSNFGLGQFIGSLKIVGKAFTAKIEDPRVLIDEIVELADAARKGGLLSLEGKEVSSEFLQSGIQLLVDGHEPDVVKGLMQTDMNKAVSRHEIGAGMFKVIGDVAPAMGMIGTLVGLVAMLSNMDDPKSIGPAMAVALLTTLYGAMMANMFALPISAKLNLRKDEEAMVKNLIIDGLLGIQAGQNPKVIEAMLKNYLPGKDREVEE